MASRAAAGFLRSHHPWDIHLFSSSLSVKSVSSVVEIVLSPSFLTTDYTDATDKAGEAGGISSHTVAWLHLFAPSAYFVMPFSPSRKAFSLQPSVDLPEWFPCIKSSVQLKAGIAARRVTRTP
jgi:hypothetical protein